MMQIPTEAAKGIGQAVSRLRQLRLARHPMGLRARAAQRFAEEVRSSGDVAKAIRNVGGDVRVASIIEQAKPSDGLRLMSDLLPVMGEVAAQQRLLQSAALYPLAMLACLTLVSLTIYNHAVPAIVNLAESNEMLRLTAKVGGATSVSICMMLLLLLTITVYSQVQLPLLSGGRRMLGRVLVLETLARLHEQGVSLPSALRAASSWVKGPSHRAAHALAETLESGQASVSADPLLDSAGTALLISAAQRGIVAPVLSAMVQQARLASQRQLPEEVSRIHVISLLVAGLGLAVVGISFFQTYMAAVMR